MDVGRFVRLYVRCSCGSGLFPQPLSCKRPVSQVLGCRIWPYPQGGCTYACTQDTLFAAYTAAKKSRRRRRATIWPPEKDRAYCLKMAIAITEDHRALAETASDFLAKHDSRGAARTLLEAEKEELPPFWGDLASLGWLGLHLPESMGGSGYGLPELIVVVEELGRAVTPGPFVPTVIASAVIDAVGSDELKAKWLPGLADGSVCGGVALTSDITVSGGTAAGTAPAVLGGGLANVLVLPAGDDAIVVDASDGGVTIQVPKNLDPTRRCARVTLDGAAVDVIPGGRRVLVDLGRLLVAAEAVGVATECTEQAADYAKVARAVRAADRHLPGGQAPLRQHGRGVRVGHRRRVGRGAGGGRGRGTTDLRRRGGRHAGARGRRRVRQPQHAGARRHRHHVGARCARLHAAGDRARGRRRQRGRGTRRHGSCAAWGASGAHHRPAARGRADARRGAGVRGAGEGPRRGGAARGADRVRLRDAALAQALGARRRRGGAARDRAGVQGGGRDEAAVLHHRVGDPHVDPACNGGPGGPLGAAGAAPGGHLVPALQRARRRKRRGGRQDAGHPRRGRLARQRPEGVDERRALRVVRPRDDPHRPRRPQAQGHHDDGHRHARGRRRGAALEDDDRASRSSTRCSSTTSSCPTTT